MEKREMGEDREWRGERQKTVTRGDDRRENGEKLEMGERERKENEDETQKRGERKTEWIENGEEREWRRESER